MHKNYKPILTITTLAKLVAWRVPTASLLGKRRVFDSLRLTAVWGTLQQGVLAAANLLEKLAAYMMA